MIVGGLSFLSPSSRARSAGCTACAAVHGSDGRFSRPWIAETETIPAGPASKIATAETKKTACRRLVAGAEEFLSETLRFLNEKISRFKGLTAYFLSSARVR